MNCQLPQEETWTVIFTSSSVTEILLPSEFAWFTSRHTGKGATVGSPNHSHVGGSSFHVGDCQIWAEIHYLDSPTDYREYLPVHSLQGWKPLEGRLVMLDDERPHSWPVLARLSHISMTCLSGAVALALLLLLEH
jgi:hypothetical protein